MENSINITGVQSYPIVTGGNVAGVQDSLTVSPSIQSIYCCKVPIAGCSALKINYDVFAAISNGTYHIN